ncbi:MAG TPA: TAXI family TRAP transporter solute-binding subunit, partial [Dehalococcoidia bacterium]|nr:TAXI family TRAP transporter solute-binding subunit [Dehalococcoidia bacterium]
DVPEDVAYHMTKVAFEQRAALDASYPALKGTDWTQLTLENAQVPLHKGAAHYFQDVLGIQLPDRLRPPD